MPYIDWLYTTCHEETHRSLGILVLGCIQCCHTVDTVASFVDGVKILATFKGAGRGKA